MVDAQIVGDLRDVCFTLSDDPMVGRRAARAVKQSEHGVVLNFVGVVVIAEHFYAHRIYSVVNLVNQLSSCPVASLFSAQLLEKIGDEVPLGADSVVVGHLRPLSKCPEIVSS